MLLAIDIGNTNISFALFGRERIYKIWDIPVKHYTKTRLLKHIKDTRLSAALICSVVPKITGRLCSDINNITNIKPKVIGKDIKVPLKNLYLNKKQLGPDRLTNAYAASQIYPLPAIVVNCGTAITIDAVSKNKEYLGGFIIPGLSSSLSALNLSTALLPKVKIIPASGSIGRNTRTCILNGVIIGSAAAVDALILKIRLKAGGNTQVIGTGGNIDLIKKFSRYIIKTDKELLLKGIFLLFKNAFKNN
ncbi:MAG: type III pantothenate kinase [Candidatus Omnitrophica bacterium]|nr:type III pantothenate kinase [Candidatus Omnitrophota bacterium]